MLHISRQAFNKYLKTKDAPWKYQALANAMPDICLDLITNRNAGLMVLPKLIKKHYEHYDTNTMTVEQLKTLIWRYFLGQTFLRKPKCLSTPAYSVIIETPMVISSRTSSNTLTVSKEVNMVTLFSIAVLLIAKPSS